MPFLYSTLSVTLVKMILHILCVSLDFYVVPRRILVCSEKCVDIIRQEIKRPVLVACILT